MLTRNGAECGMHIDAVCIINLAAVLLRKARPHGGIRNTFQSMRKQRKRQLCTFGQPLSTSPGAITCQLSITAEIVSSRTCIFGMSGDVAYDSPDRYTVAITEDWKFTVGQYWMWNKRRKNENKWYRWHRSDWDSPYLCLRLGVIL